jgi:hypothetical protein
MRRETDRQIFWVVVFGLAFWGGIFWHTAIFNWLRHLKLEFLGPR